MVYQSLLNIALIYMGIGPYLQKLHDIWVFDGFLIFRFRRAGLYLRRHRGLVLACKQPLIIHRIDLPFKLSNTPSGFCTFLCIEVTGRLVSYLHKYAVIRPAQFVAQCVTNWIGHVKLTHSPKIAFVKAFAEFSGKSARKVLQKILTIFSSVILSASLVYLLTNLPIGYDIAVLTAEYTLFCAVITKERIEV